MVILIVPFIGGFYSIIDIAHDLRRAAALHPRLHRRHDRHSGLNPAIDTMLTAETPEGIAISIRPAGFAVRATPFLSMRSIRFVLLMICATVLCRRWIRTAARYSAAGCSMIVLFVLNWLYPVIFELTAAAATPGKRIMGLVVLMANGLPITPAGCLIRNLCGSSMSCPCCYACGIVSHAVAERLAAHRRSRRAAPSLPTAYEVQPGGSLAEASPCRLPSPCPVASRSLSWRSPSGWVGSPRSAPRRSPSSRAGASHGTPAQPLAHRAARRRRALAARRSRGAYRRGAYRRGAQRRGAYRLRRAMTALEFETANGQLWSELEKGRPAAGARARSAALPCPLSHLLRASGARASAGLCVRHRRAARDRHGACASDRLPAERSRYRADRASAPEPLPGDGARTPRLRGTCGALVHRPGACPRGSPCTTSPT